MDTHQKVLFVDASSGFYRTERYRVGDFFGPVDLGLHLAGKHHGLNIGVGLLAGSIFPGSNRLFFTAFSPCWGSFFISSMGGAGLIFDNLGLNMLSLVGRAPTPSVLVLHRKHGEVVEVEVAPVDLHRRWADHGVYSLMDWALETFGHRYDDAPRILAVGPAALATDFGGIVSVPIAQGRFTHADTWAGRGGMGSKMLQDHGIAAIVYGGSVADVDFRDRKVADGWFQDRYHKRLAAKDLESTIKYRYDPKFHTGGTFGVNYATMGGRLMAFNYRSIYWPEEDRLDLHRRFIQDHYLKQFNEETIIPKNHRTCGEPCAAVCKKLRKHYKKDYEPYQTMGPLCGIFDQPMAEELTHRADALGFDAISVGGVLSWLMEALAEGHLRPEEVGASHVPHFALEGFAVEADSRHNGAIGLEILDAMVEKKGVLDLSEGARKLARRLARERGKALLDSFLYVANARKGWMVPNQYWTPGALAPMAIMGKYYMHYGADFYPPRELGRLCADRMIQELVMDNLGLCRFHRQWGEEMLPQIMESLYGMKEAYIQAVTMTASRINSRNSAIFWESGRCLDMVHTYLRRQREVEGNGDPELARWLEAFDSNREEGALAFWFEALKGIHESLREF